MKRAVSISIGSSQRDKRVEVDLLGETIVIERIGTDGDMKKAAQLFAELDGTVDALGVGGADLMMIVDGKNYPFHNVKPMVKAVQKTPVVDGTGLKLTLEYRAVGQTLAQIGEQIDPKQVLFTAGTDRWGMSQGFADAGFDCVFGDLMFGLGIPIPIRTLKGVKRMAAIALPIALRLPFEMIYPTGEKQEKIEPKFEKWYAWASVIAGDCHYIKRNMPNDLGGKTIFTNTTTPADVEAFRTRGVRYLVTTTPVLDGRSFGTNMMEAALVALSGKGRALTAAEYNELIDKLGLEPQIQTLN